MKKNIIFLLLLFISSVVWATDYHVTATGDGTKAGNDWANAMDEAAFETHVEASAVAGDIYYFLDGDYDWSARSVISVLDGTVDAYISLIGVSATDYTESGRGSSNRPNFTMGNTPWSFDNFWSMRNFIVDSDWDDAIDMDTGALLQNISLTQTPPASISTAFNVGTTSSIIDCDAISDGDGSVGIAVYVGATDFVMGCYFKNFSIGVNTVGGDSHTIINNVFVDCRKGILTSGLSVNNRVINNTFIGNDSAEGIDASTGNDMWVIYNNIFKDYTSGLDWADIPSTIVNDNNDFYSCTSTGVNITIGANSITADPEFPGSGDYSVGTNLKARGFPSTFLGIGSGTTSYLDIGAVQRVEPTASGGTRANGSLSVSF